MRQNDDLRTTLQLIAVEAASMRQHYRESGGEEHIDERLVPRRRRPRRMPVPTDKACNSEGAWIL